MATHFNQDVYVYQQVLDFKTEKNFSLSNEYMMSLVDEIRSSSIFRRTGCTLELMTQDQKLKVFLPNVAKKSTEDLNSLKLAVAAVLDVSKKVYLSARQRDLEGINRVQHQLELERRVLFMLSSSMKQSVLKKLDQNFVKLNMDVYDRSLKLKKMKQQYALFKVALIKQSEIAVIKLEKLSLRSVVLISIFLGVLLGLLFLLLVRYFLDENRQN